MNETARPWSVIFLQIAARCVAAVCFLAVPIVLFAMLQTLEFSSNFLLLVLVGLVAAFIDCGLEYLASINASCFTSAQQLTKIVESQARKKTNAS